MACVIATGGFVGRFLVRICGSESLAGIGTDSIARTCSTDLPFKAGVHLDMARVLRCI